MTKFNDAGRAAWAKAFKRTEPAEAPAATTQPARRLVPRAAPRADKATWWRKALSAARAEQRS